MPQPVQDLQVYSPSTLALKNAAANGPLTDYVESAINDAIANMKAYVDAALAQANALLAQADAEHVTLRADIQAITDALADQLNTDKYAVTRASIIRLMQALKIYAE